MKELLLSLRKKRLLIVATIFLPLIIILLFLSRRTNFILDLLDYPLVIFLTTTQTRHLANLEFSQLTESLMFYPHQHSMFFTDTFLLQSLLNLPFYLLTQQPILSFNLSLVLNLSLIIFSAYWIVKNQKNNFVKFISTTLLSLSPFLILNTGHLQMISIWPTYFALSFLLKEKQKLSDFFWIGLWTGVQFYGSIYLFLLFCFLFATWAIIKFLSRPKNRLTLFKNLIFSFSTIVIITAWGLWHYLQAQQLYGINYQYSEYVQYAADPIDYLSINSYQSLFSQLPIRHFYNLGGGTTYGKIGFLGFGLISLALFGTADIWQRRKRLKTNDWLLILMIPIGLVFSFGPRLTLNGHYTAIRLPYDLILKLIPLVKPLRVTARWSLWFYTGAILLAIKGVEILWQQQKKFLLALLFILFLLEVIPIGLKPAVIQQPKIYQQIESQCKNGGILLEYPLSLDQNNHSASEIASYWSRIVLAISFHECPTINGYSGYFPEIYRLEKHEQLKRAIEQDGANLVKLNLDQLDHEEAGFVSKYLSNLYLRQVYSDDHFLLFTNNSF